jgi:hypothetical protein
MGKQTQCKAARSSLSDIRVRAITALRHAVLWLASEHLTMLRTDAAACWVRWYSHATVAGERGERSGRCKQPGTMLHRLQLARRPISRMYGFNFSS